MPRKAKPGANRTDLLSPSITPENAGGQPNGQGTGKIDGVPRVATGLPYGEHQELQQSVQASPTPQPGGQPADIQATLGNAMARDNWQMPSLTPLDAPTNRPMEHVMTGAMGRPDAINVSRQASLSSPTPVASLLDQLSSLTGSPDLQALASQAHGMNQ